MPYQIDRRDWIRMSASALLAVPAAFAGGAPRFFTPGEFAMLDELTELIIPSDEHSPGARPAKVAAYIDARIAEALADAERDDWRNGLKSVDQLSRKMHGHAFMEASPAERIAVLERLARNEMNPKTPQEVFFRDLKHATAHAYYTSEIGIHQEMEYKGNVMLQEFAGYEVK